jgi:hypothetical protein
MKLLGILFVLAIVSAVYNAEEGKMKTKKLQIGIKKRVENCPRTSKKGDKLSM